MEYILNNKGVLQGITPIMHPLIINVDKIDKERIKMKDRAISKTITLKESEWNKLDNSLTNGGLNKKVQLIVRDYLQKNEKELISDLFYDMRGIDFRKVDTDRDNQFCNRLELITGEKTYRVYDFSNIERNVIFTGETFKVIRNSKNMLSLVFKTRKFFENNNEVFESII